MNDSNATGMEPGARSRPHVLLKTGPALALLVLISLGFNWPYLTSGFQGEDYIFLNMLKQEPLPFSRVLGLWSTWDMPAITSIWWFEGEGGKMGGFWRTVPSLLFEGSVRVFGERAFPLHLFYVVVHGLVGGTLFLLVRRLTGRPFMALLAGLFFLSCEDHTLGVGWIAMGTDLVCVLFVNLSLLAHAQWLENRRRWALVASLAALVIALLSKESAVTAPLVIVLLTLAMPRGHDVVLPATNRAVLRASAVVFLRDWVSWVPAVAVLVLYLAAYKILGFGGVSSGLYVDPFTDPVRFVVHLFAHLPVMWLATLSPVPPYLTMFWPATIAAMAVAGAIAFVIWVMALWPMRRSALAAWAMGLYLLALLPQMASDASERGLYFPTIGSSILLALLLVQIGPIARRIIPAAPRSPALTRIVGWASFLCVLVPGVVLSAAMPLMYVPAFDKPDEQTATMFPHVDERDPNHIVVLNTAGPIHTFYLTPLLAYHVGQPIDVRVLSSMNGVMSVERVDERSFVLRTDRAGWLTNMFAGMLRSTKPPKPGRVYEKDLFTVTLLEMTQQGSDVLAVRFDMDRPLEDSGVLFMQWDGETFHPIDLGALPAGEIVTLADTLDVWASMW